MEQRLNIVADKPADDALPPLVGGVIGEDTLWACTTCGYCEAACPIELEHLPRFFRMRQHRVMMDGEFPHELKAVFAAYESQSNPWGLSSDARADWARELDVPVVTTPEQMQGLDYLFYVGSAESFDPRGQKVARAIVAILRSAGVSFGILGAAESSTGECVRRAGNEMLFQQLAATLVGTLNGLAVTRIVTGDPHAFNSLLHEYPEFGGRYEVIHHTQLIARLLAEGRIRVDAAFERVIYHEPCYLGRHNGEYEAPRAIVRQVVRDTPLEFPLAREKSMCCGAGGARMWLEEKIGTRINVARVEQALPQSPQVIATACPYCAVMMYDGVSALGRPTGSQSGISRSWSRRPCSATTSAPPREPLIHVKPPPPGACQHSGNLPPFRIAAENRRFPEGVNQRAPLGNPMKTLRWIAAHCALLVALVLAAAPVHSATRARAPAPGVNETCLMCHADKDAKSAAGRPIAVDADKFKASVHGGMSLKCTDCHSDGPRRSCRTPTS